MTHVGWKISQQEAVYQCIDSWSKDELEREIVKLGRWISRTDRYRGRKRRIGPRNCTFEQRDNRTTFAVPSALRFSGNRRTGARYRLRKTSVHALTIFPSSYALAVFVDTRQVRDRSESCAFNSHPDLLLLNLCVPIRLFIARYLNRIYRRTRRLNDFVKLINYSDIVR